jgi:single-strand DNA-binding protein
VSWFSINQITLSGNLTRDPELRSTSGGTSVASLRIANNTSRKNQSTGEWEDKPNYFNLTAWGGLGEQMAEQLAKGDAVVVAGRVEHRTYEHEGQKREAYDVIVDSFVRATGKGSGGGGAPRSSAPASDVPADTADFAPAATPAGSTDDDIPF